MKPETEQHRAQLVRFIVLAGVTMSMLMSQNLWFAADRQFPKVALFSLLTHVPGELDVLLSGILLIGCTVFAAVPSHRVIGGIIALAAGLMLALLDQLRWQPWCYQYWLTVLILIPMESPKTNPLYFMNLVRRVSIATYLWSGIHKCNHGFSQFYGSWVKEDFLSQSPEALRPLIENGYWIAGPLEILIGILLVFPASRRPAVVLVCFMHLAILLFLGPIFNGDNLVILPWNSVMIALAIVLFWNFKSGLGTPIPGTRGKLLVWTVGLLLFFMPMLSMMRAWPLYLSFHLYSGQQQRMQLVLTPTGVAKLDEDYQKHLLPSPVSNKLQVIDYLSWSLDTLNVPVVDESRVLLAISQQLAGKFSLTPKDGFFYHDFPNYLDRITWAKYTPQEILVLKELPELPSLKGAHQ
ncbi:MAG: hypothetical protein GY899_02590 [Verrucomicrobiaceae bacterium]|nr:hypothetical protein [Verrucomicrobiaceae bacterium]